MSSRDFMLRGINLSGLRVMDAGTVHFLLTPCYPQKTRFDVCLWAPPSIKTTDLSKAVQSIKKIVNTLEGERLTTLAFEKEEKDSKPQVSSG